MPGYRQLKPDKEGSRTPTELAIVTGFMFILLGLAILL